MVTSSASNTDTNMESVSRDRSPLLVSEAQSPYSDSEHLQFDGCSQNVDSMVISCEKVDSNETEMSVLKSECVTAENSSSDQSNENHSISVEHSSPMVSSTVGNTGSDEEVAEKIDKKSQLDTNGIIDNEKAEANQNDSLKTGKPVSLNLYVHRLPWKRNVKVSISMVLKAAC